MLICYHIIVVPNIVTRLVCGQWDLNLAGKWGQYFSNLDCCFFSHYQEGANVTILWDVRQREQKMNVESLICSQQKVIIGLCVTALTGTYLVFYFREHG
jgi:hypothetical protein